MSRSGYSDDYEADYPNAIWLYRQAVERAISGRRGQKLLCELAGVLDAMPVKRLALGSFVNTAGDCCTLGALGNARGTDMSELQAGAELARQDEGLDDYGVPQLAGDTFGVARSLAAEIMYENDEGDCWGSETPEERWQRMRRWVASKIRSVT